MCKDETEMAQTKPGKQNRDYYHEIKILSEEWSGMVTKVGRSASQEEMGNRKEG